MGSWVGATQAYMIRSRLEVGIKQRSRADSDRANDCWSSVNMVRNELSKFLTREHAKEIGSCHVRGLEKGGEWGDDDWGEGNCVHASWLLFPTRLHKSGNSS